MLAFVGAQTVAVAVFYRPERNIGEDEGKGVPAAQPQTKDEPVEKLDDAERASISKPRDDAASVE